MKKIRKSKAVVLDTFILSFVGQFVNIVCKIPNEQGALLTEQEGFILDRDEEFLYLGRTSREIDYCIKRNEVVLVESVAHKTKYEKALDKLPIPNNDDGVN